MTHAGNRNGSSRPCRSMVGPNSDAPIFPSLLQDFTVPTHASFSLAQRKPRDHRYQHLPAFTIHTSSSMASRDTGLPLPKFGEWDVSNPASAEGYTIIFKRARDEKKTGYANM